jgi:hypothetical protein
VNILAEIESVEVVYRDKDKRSFVINNVFDYINSVVYNPFTKNYTIKALYKKIVIPKREIAQINITYAYVNDISEEETDDNSEDD